MQKQTKYTINATVNFDTPENGLSYNPTKNEFIAAFEKVLLDMQSVTAEVLRIIQHANFNQFIQGLISDSGPKFKTIVENSFTYHASKEAITARIEMDFRELHQEVQKIENCRDVHDFEQSFDFEEFKSQHSDVETIKNMLEKLNKWDISVSKNIKANSQSGLIAIQGKKLREKLNKKVKDEQFKIKEYLLELAESKQKEIIKSLGGIKTTLGKA